MLRTEAVPNSGPEAFPKWGLEAVTKSVPDHICNKDAKADPTEALILFLSHALTVSSAKGLTLGLTQALSHSLSQALTLFLPEALTLTAPKLGPDVLSN